MKIVINQEFGGFGLSDKAFEYWCMLSGITYYRWGESSCYGSNYSTIPESEYKELENMQEALKANGKYSEDIAKKLSDSYIWSRNIERNDANLVKVIEVLGQEANGFSASLKVVDIPDDVDWQICEYDGIEWVAERHRTWN